MGHTADAVVRCSTVLSLDIQAPNAKAVQYSVQRLCCQLRIAIIMLIQYHPLVQQTSILPYSGAALNRPSNNARKLDHAVSKIRERFYDLVCYCNNQHLVPPTTPYATTKLTAPSEQYHDFVFVASGCATASIMLSPVFCNRLSPNDRDEVYVIFF